MSLYIPKLNIPEKGARYICIRADGTVTNLHGDPLGVTAIEMPDHGDLIDRDEIKEQWFTTSLGTAVVDVCEIDAATAIIPADPGKEANR